MITRQPQLRAPQRRVLVDRRTRQTLPTPERRVLVAPRPRPSEPQRRLQQRLDRRPEPPVVRVDPSYRRNLSRRYRWYRCEPTYRLGFWDRPARVYRPRSIYRYRDHWQRWHECRVAPGFTVDLCYRRGPRIVRRRIHPYLHRKYIFVSLGGSWPVGSLALRYYWYGWHPYDWYGYDPVAYELAGTTQNIYTYNFYDADGALVRSRSWARVTDAPVLDPPVTPPAQRPVDVHFDIAVKAFEQADYPLAVDHLAMALALAPEDPVLQFAYCQSLFAARQYAQAAEVLRRVYSRDDWARDDAFFPRGLYPEETVLFDQIDDLVEAVEKRPADSDLTLLLGYQLLGVGEFDRATTYIVQARQTPRNRQAADALLDLVVRLQAERAAGED